MPFEYERMKDEFYKEFIKMGHTPEKATKMAKTKAAKIYNSKHPDKPVHRGYEQEMEN